MTHLGLAAALSYGALSAVLISCSPSSQAFRLNPEVSPEHYRVTCRKAFRPCERKAKEVCDGRFITLQRLSNVPEQRPVSESDLSSTGPSQGAVSFQGELIIECGDGLSPLRLERESLPPEASNEAVAEPSEVPSEVPAAPQDVVCVPGSTQACLGPGACSGAQACGPDGRGYEACDCGPVEQTPPAAVPPASEQKPPAAVPPAAAPPASEQKPPAAVPPASEPR